MVGQLRVYGLISHHSFYPHGNLSINVASTKRALVWNETTGQPNQYGTDLVVNFKFILQGPSQFEKSDIVTFHGYVSLGNITITFFDDNIHPLPVEKILNIEALKSFENLSTLNAHVQIKIEISKSE